MQEERFKLRMKEELKTEEMKLKMKKKIEEKKDIVVNGEKRVQVILPNIVITKFEGSSLYWFRFWNQVETKIDKLEVSPISKFLYLKVSCLRIKNVN